MGRRIETQVLVAQTSVCGVPLELAEMLDLSEFSEVCGPSILAFGNSPSLLKEPHRLKSVPLNPLTISLEQWEPAEKAAGLFRCAALSRPQKVSLGGRRDRHAETVRSLEVHS